MSPAFVLEPTYRRLKRELLDGRFAMGAKLEALRLADDFGVSMTPVRDSLNQLVGEGLVSLTPGNGFRVAIINEQTFREMLEVNFVLLDYALQAGKPPLPGDRNAEPIDTHAAKLRAVFRIFASCSGNRFLVGKVEQISERLQILRNLEPDVLTGAVPMLSSLEQSVGLEPRHRREALKRYHAACEAAVPDLISALDA